MDKGIGSNLFEAKVTILGGGGIAEDVILLEPLSVKLQLFGKAYISPALLERSN